MNVKEALTVMSDLVSAIYAQLGKLPLGGYLVALLRGAFNLDKRPISTILHVFMLASVLGLTLWQAAVFVAPELIPHFPSRAIEAIRATPLSPVSWAFAVSVLELGVVIFTLAFLAMLLLISLLA